MILRDCVLETRILGSSYENDHKYTNKEKDEDTGLYYYGARYYNSEAGVFTAQDPVYLRLGTGSLGILNDPQGLNSYSYSRNNPINLCDPDGNWFKSPMLLNKVFSFFGFGEQVVETALVSGVDQVINHFFQPVTTQDLVDSVTNVALGAGSLKPVISSAASIGDDIARIASDFKWKNVGKLFNHFERHGSALGANSVEDYVGKAREFYDNVSNYERILGKDGVMRAYDDSANTFGSYNSDGSSRTFFKPEDGRAYWERQVADPEKNINIK